MIDAIELMLPYSRVQRSDPGALSLILGSSAAGSALASFIWRARLVAQGYQVVWFDPLGHNQRIKATGHGNRFRYDLTMDMCLNVLDVRWSRVDLQVEEVLRQLSFVVGLVQAGEEKLGARERRVWSHDERAVLRQAVRTLYAPWANDIAQLQPEHAPIMRDLCDVLRAVDHDVARTLADEITRVLVKTPVGQRYTQRTSVTWDFSHDLSIYDFSGMPEGPTRAFGMSQALAAFNHYLYASSRDSTRPAVLFFDAFATTLGDVWPLASWATESLPQWRALRAALVACDPHALPYFEHGGAYEIPALRWVFAMASRKLIFRHDDAAAARLGASIQGADAEDHRRILSLHTHECIVVTPVPVGFGGTATQVGHVLPTAAELDAFHHTTDDLR